MRKGFSGRTQSPAAYRFLTAFLTDPEQPDFTSHRFLTGFSQTPLTGFSQLSHRKNDLIIPNDSTPSAVTVLSNMREINIHYFWLS